VGRSREVVKPIDEIQSGDLPPESFPLVAHSVPPPLVRTAFGDDFDADELGLHPETVRDRIKNYDLKIRNKSDKYPKLSDETYLRERYFDRNMSGVEIAEELG
jgi:hypothetical protein